MRLRRVVIGGTITALVSSVLTIVGGSVPNGAPAPRDRSVEAPDAATAAVLASAQGSRVEVAAERTSTRTVYANPGGTMTAEFSAVPVRVKQGGSWVTIDTTLVRKPDGRIGPKAAEGQLTLSGGGRRDDLASMHRDGREFAIQWPDPLPQPVLSANKATYPEVLPGVDLVMIAERSGYQQHLVIKSADAARNPKLATVKLGVRAPGLKLLSDKGTLKAVDEKGTEVFTSPQSKMWDSSGSDPVTAKSAPVDVSFVDGSLVIVPDQKFLAEDGVVYPVTVDPPWSPPGIHGWATVLSGKPTDKYWWTSGDHPWAQVGQCHRGPPDYCNGIGEAWAYFEYDTGFLHDKPVVSATLDTSVVRSPSCAERNFEVYRVGGGYDIWDGMTWNSRLHGHRIATRSAPVVYDNCTGWKSAGVELPAGEVERTARSTYFLKAADSGDQLAWRKFDPGSTILKVTYNRSPSSPTDHMTDPPLPEPCANCGGVTYSSKDSIRLSARLSDPDGDMVDPRWWVNRGGEQEDTGWLGQFQSSGAFHGKNVNLTDLHGKKIEWAVMGGDGRAASDWAFSPRPFVVDRVGITKEPTVSGVLYQEDNRWHGGAGVADTFTFGANGVDDVDHYLYGWQDPPSNKVNANGLGGSATVTIAPPGDNLRELFVQSVDKAGNKSTKTRVYRIYVRSGNGPAAQWSMEGNARDTAFLGDRHGTLEGGASFTSGGAIGSGVELDGVDDHVSAPNAIRNDAGFTVSAWVNLKVDRGARAVVSQDGALFPGFALWFRAEGDGSNARWAFGVPNSTTEGKGVQVAESPAGMPQQNTWTHLAGVRDPVNKQVRLYVNGVLAGSVPFTAVAEFAPGKVRIGQTMWHVHPAVDHWKGTIDEVQLHDRALTEAEIAAAVGQSNVHVAHWKFDEDGGKTARNSVEGGADGVLGDNASFDPKGASKGALNVNGINGTMTTSGPVLRTDQSFTVAAWVHAREFVTGGTSMTAVGQDGARNSGFYLQYNSSVNKWVFLRFTTDDDNPQWIGVSASQTPVKGEWVHLTGTFDAATRKMRIYVNGEFGNEGVLPAAPWHATGPLTVGRGKLMGTPTDFWPGLIDEVRLYSRALPEDEISGIVTRDNVKAGEWKLDGTANDTSGKALHGTLSTGGADWSAGQTMNPDPADMAVRLDGGNGFVTVPRAFDTDKSFSVAAWARLDKIGTQAAVVSQDGNNVSGFTLRALADGRWDFAAARADQAIVADQATGPAAVRGVWTHLVGVYSKDRKRIELYVNGVLAASAAHEGGFNATGPLQFGKSKWNGNPNTELFTGAIDDVFVYNRPLFASEISVMAGRDVSLGHNWTMDEGSGTAAGDSAGAKGMTLTKGTAFGAGRVGNALKFDGVDDVATTSGIDVRTDTSFTVSAWVHLDGNTCEVDPETLRCMISAVSLDGGGSAPPKFRLGYVKDLESGTFGNWIFELPERQDGVVTKASVDVFSGEDTKWVHLTGVYDAPAKAVWLFVDGTRKDDGILLSPWQATGQLRIGSGYAQGRDQFWPGRVDDVRMYSGALTIDRVSALHRSYPVESGPTALPVPDAGHWKFDEATGTTAGDSSGRASHATMKGGNGWYAGRIGATGWFDGTTGYADTAGPVLNTDRSFSVAGWGYLDNMSRYVTVFGQDGDRVSAFHMQFDPTAKKWGVVVPKEDKDNPSLDYLMSAEPAVAGWTHLAVVYDSGLEQLRLYVNGVLSGVQVGIKVRASAGAFSMGRCRWNGANGCFFPRGVDDVRAFRKALSDGEVRAIHDDAPPALHGYWRFDDGTAQDHSWRANPTTLSGTTGLTTGVIGKALQLDGATGAATAQWAGTPTHDSFTVSAWVKLSRNDRVSTVLSQEGSRQSAFLLQYRPEIGRWIFGAATADQDGSPLTYANSLQPPEVGKWTHLTGVYDAPMRQLRLYVNGQHVGTKDDTLLWPAYYPFHLGRAKENGAMTGYFNGALDEVTTDYGAASVDDIAQRANWPAPSGGQLGRFNAIGGGEHRSVYSSASIWDKFDQAPAGYRYEGPLGMMLTEQKPGSRRLYSCLGDNVDSFTSADPGCEGQVKLADLGWAYTSAPEGIATVPLRRCVFEGERFDSISPTCEGHTDDGLLGYLVGYAPLTRYYHPRARDHIASPGSAGPGYRREGMLGLVAMISEAGTQQLMSCLDGMDQFLSIDPACGGKTVAGKVGRTWTQPPDGLSSRELFSCKITAGAAAGELFSSWEGTCEGQTVISSLGYVLTAVPGPLRP
ncbi:LamG domain-containing protein [Kibdelosporangium aridum]|uniref:LamG domain-containing protein n=1 Tax=Kibdelosporangium aridum TaxID=2030 RepID=A0A428ZHE9_KIBAR|nr:LamG domain-containing protein [Kibdelosporangium aridum]RSM87388.1 LamG domain-containing protein [Kibdelosporangium aridum]